MISKTNWLIWLIWFVEGPLFPTGVYHLRFLLSLLLAWYQTHTMRIARFDFWEFAAGEVGGGPFVPAEESMGALFAAREAGGGLTGWFCEVCKGLLVVV